MWNAAVAIRGIVDVVPEASIDVLDPCARRRNFNGGCQIELLHGDQRGGRRSKANPDVAEHGGMLAGQLDHRVDEIEIPTGRRVEMELCRVPALSTIESVVVRIQHIL